MSAAPRLTPVLVYTALTAAIVSSLGMLLVPAIAHDMHVEVSAAQWTLTVNLLVGAVMTPIMGRLSDGPHKKRLLLWSLSIILLGSVVAATAPNFVIFLIGRALQGLSYGIVPVTIALARRYLPAAEVRGGISALSVTVASGLGLGYPLTGILADVLGYRFAFWAAALFLLSTVLIVWFRVPDGPDEQAPRLPFDLRGALLIGTGLAGVLLVAGEGARWGWGSPWTIGLLVVSVALLIIWALVELGTPHALVNLRTLRTGDVLVANGTAIGLGAAMYACLSITSLIAQAPTSTGYGVGLPLFWAGFVMLPLSIGSFAANRVVRRIAARIPMRALLIPGSALVAGSGLVLWLAHDELWEILIGMFGVGAGIGTTYAAMPALIARSVADAELGSAVSFNQVLRTVGGSFGSAMSGAVLAAHPAATGYPSDSGIEIGLAVGAAGCSTVLAVLVITHVLTRDKPGSEQPAAPVAAGR
ncbi:MFS transporter [Nocardia sp. NPDC048505]|uniref:MFS transporter n=1 Tax=unclassified Nocardia TaxID=2637762 RepID=UPI0033D3BB60